jgi:ubiquinone/menaquinone biosynthesis C-methylase UbiE
MEKEMFHHRSYDLHRSHYENSFDPKKLASWKNKNTVDHWRHNRMYEAVDPLIKSFPEASWITIGDGRYGTDANYLLSKGIKNVIATDISDTYLKVALEEKFITDYRIENAEQLSAADNSIDFVLCKESYHHFPRPMIALYEMLRVAKEAVILIEPNDENIRQANTYNVRNSINLLWQSIKNRIKRIQGKAPYYNYGMYETVGNYVYSISKRELEKVALALNFPVIATKGLNDLYVEGVEFEEATKQSKLFSNLKKAIRELDINSEKGISQYAMLIAIIFKQPVEKQLAAELKKAGFVVNLLSANPYLK